MAISNQEISEKLQQWRKGLGIYQKEAADLLGVPPDTYRNWEYGKNQPVKVCLECVLKKIRENQPDK